MQSPPVVIGRGGLSFPMEKSMLLNIFVLGMSLSFPSEYSGFVSVSRSSGLLSSLNRQQKGFNDLHGLSQYSCQFAPFTISQKIVVAITHCFKSLTAIITVITIEEIPGIVLQYLNCL